MNIANMTSRSPRAVRAGNLSNMGQQQDNEKIKRAVYENITKNFDIFEFLDNEQTL